MGTIKKGILGGFSGTVGTVVGANWRGMDVIRSLPKSGNSTPSAAQMLQREKFRLAIKFQNAVRRLQSRLYSSNSGVRSRVNLAASYILKESIAVQGGQPVLIMDKVLITKGDLRGFSALSVTAAGGHQLEFSWEDNSGQTMAAETDKFCTAVFEPESGEFDLKENVGLRSEGAATVVLPTTWSEKQVHVFAFFQDEAEATACNSQYLGSLTVEA